MSTLEDIFTIGCTALAAFLSAVVLGIVVLFVVLFIWLAPKGLGAIRRMLAQARTVLGFDHTVRR